MPDRMAPESILSHGEQDVAGYLRDHPDADLAAIAERRGTSEEAVRKAIDRIEAKTRRAFATLSQSPFVEEAAREIDPELRRELIETLEAAGR